ncbi:hypothetical protein GXM_10210 [Nostoc sphaeroides CCNUC1]|uniref:Uncharacterized protein n=1 Tax=Nostoc sphaeroides CCNUC1 TaxID=2653204 RepID=A0A5P8WLA3_9NOSO|nr:hypothetical protein GXM_10210 [Nostoc sphaeroides CCNUC1]
MAKNQLSYKLLKSLPLKDFYTLDAFALNNICSWYFIL